MINSLSSFRTGLCALTLTLLLPTLPACAESENSPVFDRERLARIDTRMNEAVQAGLMTGGQGLIAYRGEIVYEQSWGLADREAERATEPDTLYRIYSMTKPITSVALMMLYEQGRFLLNDPLALYLPEFAALQVLETGEDGETRTRAPARAPTIRDLLTHTAGFTYGVFGNSEVDQQYRTTELFRESTLAGFSSVLATLPLQYDPGERWHYSVAVDLQGRLVEVLSGRTLGEFFQEHIFAPLGMEDTHFVVPESKWGRLAQLYSPEGTEISWGEAWKFSRSTALEVADPEISRGYFDGSFFESGGAGLVSSSRDYLRFASMLLNEGELDGVRLLAPGTVRLIRSNHLHGVDQGNLLGLDGFGLGVGIAGALGTGGELVPEGTYGWGGAAGTLAWIDPENDIVGVFMTQSVPHQTTLSRRFQVLSYQAYMR